MTFLLMTTAILLRALAEFLNVLQRYSLTYSITYMFIVLYMESMLFSRLLLLYLHISTLIFLISVNNADMTWRLHWRQQKKDNYFDTLSAPGKLVFSSERDEEILMVHVKNPIRILNVGTESFEWFSE